MPGIKTSIYDAVVAQAGGTFDLTGKAALVDNGDGYDIGVTSIAYSDPVTTGSSVLKAGAELWRCDGGYIGKVREDWNGSTPITLESPSQSALADDDLICMQPKFEIVAIQACGEATAITALTPCENHFPGTQKSDHVTAWSDDHNESYIGAPDGNAGDAFSSSFNLPDGSTIEGRWRHVTVTSGDFCLLYLKASPVRSIPSPQRYR